MLKKLLILCVILFQSNLGLARSILSLSEGAFIKGQHLDSAVWNVGDLLPGGGIGLSHIIYYANDTDEPLMQMAVKRDLKQLKMACGSKSIFGSIILGSEIGKAIKENRPIYYLDCEGNKIYFNEDISFKIRELIEPFVSKKDFGNITKLPTALPQVFQVIVQQIIQDAGHMVEIAHYIHIKSHGTNEYPLVALDDNKVNKITTLQLSELGWTSNDYLVFKKKFQQPPAKLKVNLTSKPETADVFHLSAGHQDTSSLGGLDSNLSLSEKLFSKLQLIDAVKEINVGIKIYFLFVESCGAIAAQKSNGHLENELLGDQKFPSFFFAKSNILYNNLNWYKIAQPRIASKAVNISSKSDDIEFFYNLQLALFFMNTNRNINSTLIERKRSQHLIDKNDFAYQSVSIDEEREKKTDDSDYLDNKFEWGKNRYLCVTNKAGKLYCNDRRASEQLVNLKELPSTSKLKKILGICDIWDENKEEQNRVNNAICGIADDGILNKWNFTGEHFSSIKYSKKFKSAFFSGERNIDFSSSHFCGLDFDSNFFCLGDNFNAQIDWPGYIERPASELRPGEQQSIVANTNTFFEVLPKIKFIDFALGTGSTCGIDNQNKLICWGRNEFPDAFVWTVTTVANPPQVVLPKERFIKVVKYGFQTCAISEKKQLWCWGLNDRFQIVNEPIYWLKEPILVAKDKKFLDVYLNDETTCAIADDGKRSLWCWGSNEYGQIDMNLKDSVKVVIDPLLIDRGTGYLQVSIGKRVTCGVTTEHHLRCWGDKVFFEN